ncbi:MAG TPA: HAMP domain-containing sensor histidine kinase [Steroidobacteraceae bacterium]|nr:HAMP domain-containing sensor histidine kinase [Steroidobacteraceae bacterium]
MPVAAPIAADAPRSWAGWQRYLVGVGLTVLAWLASLAMQAVTGGRVVIIPFFPAMIAVALYAGVGPGVMSTVITVLIAFTSWRGGWGANSYLPVSDAWALLMFVLSATLIMIIAARLRQVEQRRAELLALERQAREEAERAGRMKDEFLATLSHELRNPLSAIVGWAQVLHTQPLPPQVVRGLEVIERNARAQTRIVDDLLDMSRISAGMARLDIRNVDLQKVVDAAILPIQPAAHAKRITIDRVAAASPLTASCDPDRLQQVIANLLTNAVKFTPEGGWIEVRLEHRPPHVEISVRDNGIGIDPGFLPFVFDRFRQADPSSTRQHSGLGLGLSICKQLVELHGGTIRASSDGTGKGSTFTIRLPVSDVVGEPGS